MWRGKESPCPVFFSPRASGSRRQSNSILEFSHISWRHFTTTQRSKWFTLRGTNSTTNLRTKWINTTACFIDCLCGYQLLKEPRGPIPAPFADERWGVQRLVHIARPCGHHTSKYFRIKRGVSPVFGTWIKKHFDFTVCSIQQVSQSKGYPGAISFKSFTIFFIFFLAMYIHGFVLFCFLSWL